MSRPPDRGALFGRAAWAYNRDMKAHRRIVSLTLLACLAAPAVAQSTMAGALAAEDIPAYNSQPPTPGQKLPPILKPEQLSPSAKQRSFQAKAYEVAARIHRTLHQLPCMCHCDRGFGHNSLRSCFTDEHGAHCGTCMQELFYADQQLKLGKTPKQIREGILRGEASQIDLNRV
jgi:Protein of unknown function with PCYCGC motif